MRKNNVADIIDRLQKIFCVSNDSQLSEAMSIKRSTVGSWRSRESIPYAECVVVSKEKNISLDWLLTGEGEMYKTVSNGPLKVQEEILGYKVAPQLTPREIAVLKMFNSLTEDEKQDIQKALEEKKRLGEIEAEMKRLSKELEKVKRGA